MADKNKKYPENVPGVFYVSEECIDCKVCQETAPNNFNIENGYARVDKQPENDEEYQMCIDAMDACPVDVIGDDGDE